MSRADWIELSAFLCVISLLLGIGAAFLIEGMEKAAVIGTVPSWAFVLAVKLTHRKAPRITDQTSEWFI